jgi:membrane protein
MTHNGVSTRLQPNSTGRIPAFLYRKVWSEAPSNVSKTSFFRNALVKILSIVVLKVMQDAVMFRARGLALTAVLAIVPMLALGTAILKGVGISEETQHLAHAFFDRMVISSTPSPEDAAEPEKDVYKGIGVAPPLNAETEVPRQNLVIHVQQIVDKIFAYINGTDFATLGFAGTVVILILVASFFAHLETSMNTIWVVQRGRSPLKRGLNYLAVLILLPIAINLGFAAMAVLQSPTLMEKLKTVLPNPWMVSLLLKMLPAVVVSGTFAALYKFIPNTNVSTLFSVSGGLLAGITWLLVLLVYINLQLGVARYNAIYGSFATVPLILLWIYMGWVIFLIGAELVFAFQLWRDYEPWTHLLPTDRQLALVIDVFMVLKREQTLGHFIDAEDLVKLLKIPMDRIVAALEDLERIGFIQKRKNKDAVIVPTVSGMHRFGK